MKQLKEGKWSGGRKMWEGDKGSGVKKNKEKKYV